MSSRATILYEPVVGSDIFGQINGVFSRFNGYVNRVGAPYIAGMSASSVGANNFDGGASIAGMFKPATARFTTNGNVNLVGNFQHVETSLTFTGVVPRISAASGQASPTTGHLTGEVIINGEINGEFASLASVLLPFGPPFLISNDIPTLLFSREQLNYVGGFGIMQGTGLMKITRDTGNVMFMLDSIDVVGSIGMTGGFAFFEMLHVAADLSGGGSGTRAMTLATSIAIIDSFQLVYSLVLNETLMLDDVNETTLHLLLGLADVIDLHDSVEHRRDAIIAVASAVYLADLMRQGYVIPFDESMALGTVLDARVAHMVSLMEALDVSAAHSMHFNAFIVSSDEVHLTDAYTALRAAQMGFADMLFLGGVFTFAGINYTVYAMTVESAGVTEYTGWNFNSMTVVDGIAYGASDVGIHTLEGDDDDGTNIDSHVRLGLKSFGTALEKAVPAVYVGYNSTGALAMKVITTTKGVKQESWYALQAIPRGSNAVGRFDPSKGLHSTYWDFELCNIDGADFELDFIHVWRMVLNRRV